MKRRIDSLLLKTVGNGCTPEEAASALDKADELVAKYGFRHTEFQWPPEPSVEKTAASPEKSPKPSSGGRGKGVGNLARQMIIDHPQWTYAKIAAAVNMTIEGAAATEKSVRWYAYQMRKAGIQIPRKGNKNRS